jgi:RNase P protein component
VGQTVQWSYEIGLKDNRRTDSTMVIRNRTKRQSWDRQYNGHTKYDLKTIVGQTVQWSYEIGPTDNRRTDSTMVIRNRTKRQS